MSVQMEDYSTQEKEVGKSYILRDIDVKDIRAGDRLLVHMRYSVGLIQVKYTELDGAFIFVYSTPTQRDVVGGWRTWYLQLTKYLA